jgi:hypothetical protein
MDADELSLVLDASARNRVFLREFVTVGKNRKNPVSWIVRGLLINVKMLIVLSPLHKYVLTALDTAQLSQLKSRRSAK